MLRQREQSNSLAELKYDIIYVTEFFYHEMICKESGGKDMSKVAICIAEGCEEIEALTVVDLLRRAGIDIDMISVMNIGRGKGSHNISFTTDKNMKDINWGEYDAVVLPGGMPGTNNLRDNANVVHTVQTFFEQGKLVAAICAAPTVFGTAGILKDKKACCYPGMEDGLLGATVSMEPVVVDGNIITSRGMGTAIDFGLAIIEYLIDKEAADNMAEKIVYNR